MTAAVVRRRRGSNPSLAEGSDPKTSNRPKVLGVAGRKADAVLQCGRCDEGVGHTEADLPSNPAGPFRDRAIHGDLPKGSEDTSGEISPLGAGEELRPSDD